ncbi:DNase I-like protein, partial [Pholiota conissans]
MPGGITIPIPTTRDASPPEHSDTATQIIEHVGISPQHKTRAALKIATLNMRGRFSRGIDKWMHINQIMRAQKIGVLCLQETHLSPEDTESIHNLFGKRLQVYCSINPAQPNAAGIAIVINKDLAKSDTAQATELVPGRALLVVLPWHPNHTINILGIYAPNIPAENTYFWEKLLLDLRDMPTPDIMLGDFNMVEDALDRLPPKRDARNSVEALSQIKLSAGLVDGWRNTYPTQLQYTYAQSVRQGAAHSRIDRIYVKGLAMRFTGEWETCTPGIPTDHQMVTMRLSDQSLPFIGKGKWNFPLHLLSSKTCLNQLTELCAKALSDITDIIQWLPTYNAQTIFEKLKSDIKNYAIIEGRRATLAIDKQIASLSNQKYSILNNPDINLESRQLQASIIQENIKVLADLKHRKARDELHAKFEIESEIASSGFWAR